jgi:hypothetical protein
MHVYTTASYDYLPPIFTGVPNLCFSTCITVGRGGAAIGMVGKAARLELEDIFGQKVHLIINVRAP